ncbi:uncharacterized protein LTR77_007793 [Saxophila tyrrhenica]|uniref:Uncharacterized protein n=1 Tax=Saxophila tyrrhenica TaxID=1690608 RepID=A0AAV9P706_9PEZI|nr:hypothetical protein LTR77_007793 [Saxophila tyrrhenica]
MCVIEKRLYSYQDGRQRTIESTKYCRRAVGTRVCNRVERRSVQPAQIVERRPSTADGPSTGSYIVTEGAGGRTRVYRDLSNRSSNSSSVRRSNTSERSPISIPSTNSSPSVATTRTSAFSPPDTAPSPPFMQERTRAPYPPPDPAQIIRPDGTAIYDRPPSLEMPRATDNERPRRRRESDSSMTAEVDDSQPPSPPQPRRRPSVRIDTTHRPSSSSSRPNVASPGLSELPDPRGGLRREASHRTYQTTGETSSRRREEREEDSRQAQIERDRIAASERRQSERRQSAREDAAARSADREASREREHERRRQERHRRAAAEALEGSSYPPQSPAYDAEAARRFEEAQMGRERERNAALRNSIDAAGFYTEDQLSRDAEARRLYYSARRSPVISRTSSRRLSGASYNAGPGPSSPMSARSSMYHDRAPPVVHHHPPRSRDSISARGEEVIAQEQDARERAAREQAARAAAATDRLNEAMGGMRVDDGGAVEYVEEYEFGEGAQGYVRTRQGAYYDDGGRRRRRSGRYT